ncbi:MAG: M20/M25/M40 family metallo-hydrolase, partial [Bacillota bacterium]
MEDLLYSKLNDYYPRMLNLLEKMVNIDSGSNNNQGIKQVLGLIEPLLGELGFNFQRITGTTGPHLLARGSRAPNFLLVGHVDTVFQEGTATSNPFSRKDKRIYGPGVADMKAGVVGLLYTLRVLADVSRIHHQAAIILNSDEEISSPGSRELIAEEAARVKAGFVFESSPCINEIITGASGVGKMKLEIKGRSSHAGDNPEAGLSANLELARKIIELEGLTELDRGLLVNVGTMEGGTARNVIPGQSRASIDLRFNTLSDGERLVSEIKKICHNTTDPGYRVRLKGGLSRPPYHPDRASKKLLAMLTEAGSRMGL